MTMIGIVPANPYSLTVNPCSRARLTVSKTDARLTPCPNAMWEARWIVGPIVRTLVVKRCSEVRGRGSTISRRVGEGHADLYDVGAARLRAQKQWDREIRLRKTALFRSD